MQTCRCGTSFVLVPHAAPHAAKCDWAPRCATPELPGNARATCCINCKRHPKAAPQPPARLLGGALAEQKFAEKQRFGASFISQYHSKDNNTHLSPKSINHTMISFNLLALASMLLSYNTTSAAGAAEATDLLQEEAGRRYLRHAQHINNNTTDVNMIHPTSHVERHLVDCTLPSGNFRLKHNSRWLQMEPDQLSGLDYMIKASKNKDGSTTKWNIKNSNELYNVGRSRYARKDTSCSNPDNRFKGGSASNAETVAFQATNGGTDCTNVKIKIGSYWVKHDGGVSTVKSVDSFSDGTTWTIVTL